MSKQINHLFKKLLHTKHILLHVFIVTLLGLGFFGVIQNISAQESSGGEGFSIINDKHIKGFTGTNKNVTTLNFGTILFSGNDTINSFNRNRSGINTLLYDTGELVYFNNFDSENSLKDNLVPYAKSSRDFSGIKDSKGWSYYYITKKKTLGVTNQCKWMYSDSEECLNNFYNYLNRDTLPYLESCDGVENGKEKTQFHCCTNIPHQRDYDDSGTECFQDGNPQIPGGDIVQIKIPIKRTCKNKITSVETDVDSYILTKLEYSESEKIRKIGDKDIKKHGFANIGEEYSHPGSGTNESIVGLQTGNNIPIVWERESSLSGKIKIINTIKDDINACGNGIKYKIYKGKTGANNELTGLENIYNETFNNLFSKKIERSGSVNNGDRIFFEIDNNGDNECDGTWNDIEIYDITNGEEVSGPPTINSSGKYGGALEFDGTHQKYSLGTGVNQGTGITISARVKTNNVSETQAIITKKNSYGIIIKDGKIWVSPSTYWMWHDTGIPITTDRTHITRTYDGQKMNVYKNGGKGNPGGLGWPYNISGSLTTGNDLTFIGYDEINTGRGRNGLIDEVRMYNTELKSGQVQQLYESNLKIDKLTPYREFINKKVGLLDGTYNYTGTIEILEYSTEYSTEYTGKIIVDTKGPKIHEISGREKNESEMLTVNISGTDENSPIRYKRRRNINGQQTNRNDWSNYSGFKIPAQHEPTTGLLEVQVIDGVGNITNGSGDIEWVNQAPVIATPNGTIISGYIEDELTFSVIATDTGNNGITYQWYKTDGNIEIIGATGASYKTSSNTTEEINFTVKVSDSQGENDTKLFTGTWIDEGNIEDNDFGNISGTVNENNNLTVIVTGFLKFKEKGKIGLCSNTDENVFYTGNANKIGNDYCIVQTGDNFQIVWGLYGINSGKTLFEITGNQNSEKTYIIDGEPNQFVLNFQNKNLTGFKRSLSGIDDQYNINIFDKNLLGLYNFDKILIADSQQDFMPIQSGKNRTYSRRPRGEVIPGGLEKLQYDAKEKKRVINKSQKNLFIDNRNINPDNQYGDAVIGRTSPVNAKILVEYSFELDPISNYNCVENLSGNGIKYVFQKRDSEIDTGEILKQGIKIEKNKIIEINKDESIYFKINSKQDNLCDITMYDIKIYQLPETNVASGNQGTNLGANYYEEGKYGGALSFSNTNQFVNIGTGINAEEMSISLRAKKTSNSSPQTIIEKRGSYGLVVSGNKLHVVYGFALYNTEIEIPINERTHIGLSYSGEDANIYINGKSEKVIENLGGLAANNNSTHIGNVYAHGQRNGLIDEVYIYSGAISSGHFLTLYEHNLNKKSLDIWSWSNNSLFTKNSLFSFTGTVNGINKTGGEIKRIDKTPPSFVGFLGTTGLEGAPITVSRTGILPDISSTKIDWTITILGHSITYENTGTNITIPAQDEPIKGDISVKVSNNYGFEMTNGGTIEWINTGPIITDTIKEYSGILEKLFVFNALGIDTGSELTYKRYNTSGCITNRIIPGETSQTYNTKRDVAITENFSYKIFDKQGSGSDCYDFTGIRENRELSTGNLIYSIGLDLKGGYTLNTDDITSGIIIKNGNLGICTIGENGLYYTGYANKIGNDYCIIQTDINDITSKTIVGFRNININKTFFNITGSIFQQKRLLSPTSNLFNIDIISNNLTGLTQTISGTNNTNTISGNIYTGLLAMYNFDKILIADSQQDFMPIQSGKNRTYSRRPRGKTITGGLKELQYDPISQQRLISKQVQEYDNLFIKSNILSPGDDYGDVILGRHSPINANIEINLDLSDAIATCGDGIKYEIIKSGQTISSGSYGNFKIETNIKESESIYFKINSSGNNLCDTTNYRIQIYQLPETNIANNIIEAKTFAINSGAEYTTGGKKGGAFGFTNNKQFISLGTGLINTLSMSIAFRINPENIRGNQTIIQKGSSYGIALSNGTIHVTNKMTQQRYDTKVEIEANKRTHIGRSYNGIHMKLYKNGEHIRSKYINGSIGNSILPTNIGYSLEHGQFKGKIDELYIYNYEVSKDIFTLLNQFNLNKIEPYKRTLTENKDSFTNGLYDGKYNLNITGSNDNTGFDILIDFDGPTIQETSGLTGRESSDLVIAGNLYDSGSQFSGYRRRYIINQYGTERSQLIYNEKFNITIPAQDEPTTGYLEIEAIDSFGHKSSIIKNISRINTGPIISHNQIYDYYAKIGSNIAFFANAIDTGSYLTYQRYLGTGCINPLSSETKSTFTTGSNTITTGEYYSFKAFDNLQTPSICVDLTGIRSDLSGFTNLTAKLTGNGLGGIISGNWGNLGESQTGKEIILNGKKGNCEFTGNKTAIIYTASGYQKNDSCIIELDNNQHILLAFSDIYTGFFSSPKHTYPQIISNQNYISLNYDIYIPEISEFIINRKGETNSGAEFITRNITGQDTTLLRKYSFDRILITDSTTNFSKFKNEYSWNYFRDNGTTTGNFNFNPKTQSWIINEPLQDYEYIFINKNELYPGATKYGKIIYERISNVSGSIDIESIIENANPSYCTTTDGIIYSIRKGDYYEDSIEVYSKNLSDLILNTENTPNETIINSGQKLYFIIDSKNNNQCDKIRFNAKIYFNPIHDSSLSGQTLKISGATYFKSNGRFGGTYAFYNSNNPSFLNIGIINKGTGITFDTRIKIDSTTNQTIINKQGSYGLSIKDGSIKVTTDGLRWHNTNNITTSKLTDGNRNHLLWTYDGKKMYIYLNGEQTRSGGIIGYYPMNNNNTYIGRSENNGQLNGSIDELQVRNKYIEPKDVSYLYNTHFRKINGEERKFTFSQTGLSDGIYTITGTINEDKSFTGEVKTDNNPPIIEFSGLTGDEGTGLNIFLILYDSGTNVSGFKYRYKIGEQNRSGRKKEIGTSDFKINIEAQNEPTTGLLELEARDDSNNKGTYTQIIERTNVQITTSALSKTGNQGSTIVFTASGFDPGGTTNTGYQRYLGTGCQNKLTNQTGKSFTTGRNIATTVTFSYTMFDAQGLSGNCSLATGVWGNIAPIAKDLYENASGNVDITFTATGYDPGGTGFTYQRYQGTGCEIILSNQTGQLFTTGREESGTRTFSYRLRDTDNPPLTGVNDIDNSRDCQIATGVRPYINPIAHDFNISTGTANNITTGNRKELSEVKTPELNTQITAIISSGSKGYCQITNERISFQPIVNNIGTGFCELTLTDGNNRSTKIKGWALNIDTTPPTTTITTGSYDSFELKYSDTSTGNSYYSILTGVWNTNSCGTSQYTGYNSGAEIPIIYTKPTDYRTVCYYSQDIYGNKENTKTQLFTKPKDAVPFNVTFSSNKFMKDIFEATITTNKDCSGTLTGLDSTKHLTLSKGVNTITGDFTEKSGNKTGYIFLQESNSENIFNHAHSFTIDQVKPSTPIITEKTENNNYYIIKRNPSTDDVSGIKGYNYEINNQYTYIKRGFTDVTYLNILKSDVQNNPLIYIIVQAQDTVDNLSERSSPFNITIPQIQEEIITKKIPNQFSFTKTTNAKTNTLYTSNEIVIGGLSNNTSIPISLSTGILFINDSKINNNSGLVKNGDIVYIQLYSSDLYNESTYAILLANGISATYSVITESREPQQSSTISFLDELRKLLEQLQNKDTDTNTKPTNTNTTIDTSRRSAPHTAPNKKVYNLYKTVDGKYSSHNFQIKKYFTSLAEMKSYINKNNPK